MSDSSNSSHRTPPSLIGPLVLIGIGVLFLLDNFDLLPVDAWRLLLHLWPVLLILIGIEILVGRHSTAGALLTAGLLVIVVGGLIALLVLAPDLPFFERLTSSPEMRSRVIEVPLGEATTADVSIDWNSGQGQLDALQPSDDRLIAGEVEYFGDLLYHVSTRNDHSEVRLDDRQTLVNLTDLANNWAEWSLSLHPEVAYDLSMDAGGGDYYFDLSALSLSGLFIDSGSGGFDLTLPWGGYTVEIDGGSGDILIQIPTDLPVRIELDDGSGHFNPEASFKLVSGELDDDGVWVSPGDPTLSIQLLIEIDQGSGDVTIQRYEPQE